MLTGSEPFSLLICFDATKFVLFVVFTFTETICPKTCSKSRFISAKSPLPVDVRRSKTLLLKLPNKKAIASLKPSHNAIGRNAEPSSRATSTRSVERKIEGNRLDVLFVLLHSNLFVVYLLPRLRLATLESEKEEMLHEVRQLRKMGQEGDLPRDLVRQS